MDYESSSHLTKWTFTPQELRDVRTKANNEAYVLIQQRKLEQKRLNETQSSAETTKEPPTSTDAAATPAAASTAPNPLPPPIAQAFAKGYKSTSSSSSSSPISSTIPPDEQTKFPTIEEEATLVGFYATKLLLLIGPSATIQRQKRDIKVASTACILLRRFYLSNSITVFDPKTIMVACAFLASKVEDATCDIRYLEDGTRAMSAHVKIKDIIEAEVALVKGVDFDLTCFHPYKVVVAYTEDLRTFLKSKDGKGCVNRVMKGEYLVPIYNRAMAIVEQVIFQSDVMLIASPGKVGFVAMMLANKELVEKDAQSGGESTGGEGESEAVKIDFKGYLKCRFANEKKESEIESLWQEMEGLMVRMEETIQKSELDIVILKGIHKKLKKYRIWGDDEKKKKKKRKRTDGDAEKK